MAFDPSGSHERPTRSRSRSPPQPVRSSSGTFSKRGVSQSPYGKRAGNRSDSPHIYRVGAIQLADFGIDDERDHVHPNDDISIRIDDELPLELVDYGIGNSKNDDSDSESAHNVALDWTDQSDIHPKNPRHNHFYNRVDGKGRLSSSVFYFCLDSGLCVAVQTRFVSWTRIVFCIIMLTLLLQIVVWADVFQLGQAYVSANRLEMGDLTMPTSVSDEVIVHRSSKEAKTNEFLESLEQQYFHGGRAGDEPGRENFRMQVKNQDQAGPKKGKDAPAPIQLPNLSSEGMALAVSEMDS